MTARIDADRLIARWLEAAGPTLDPEAVDVALAEARTIEQPRGLRAAIGRPEAWPPTYGRLDLPRGWRVALAATLALTLLAAALTAGGLLDRVRELLSPPSFPFVEELRPATTAQLSAFSAIRLQDGRVLIAGGVDTTVGQETVDQAWLFDPGTGRITETGRMTQPRMTPLMALLGDGRVLLVGGDDLGPQGETQPIGTAEIYDPARGAFARTGGDPLARSNSPQGAMDHAWASPQITSLRDGRVILSGGVAQLLNAAQIYDPSADAFDDVRIGCNAMRGAQVMLADGRVLVTCLPDRGNNVIEAAIFDPATSLFSPTGIPSTRANDLANLLPDGRVLFTGSSVDPGADLFDPSTGTFTTLAVSGMPDGPVAGVGIGDGRYLFVGDPDPEIGVPHRVFDAATLEFHEVEVPALRIGDATVRLADGRVLQLHYQLAASLIDPSYLP